MFELGSLKHEFETSYYILQPEGSGQTAADVQCATGSALTEGSRNRRSFNKVDKDLKSYWQLKSCGITRLMHAAIQCDVLYPPSNRVGDD